MNVKTKYDKFTGRSVALIMEAVTAGDEVLCTAITEAFDGDEDFRINVIIGSRVVTWKPEGSSFGEGINE